VFLEVIIFIVSTTCSAEVKKNGFLPPPAYAFMASIGRTL